MRFKSFLTAALCAAVLAGGSVSAALAGEVKGPPGSLATAQPGGNPDETGALDNANSICAANGLNDFDTLEGQNEFIVQSYGVDVAGQKVTSEPQDPHLFNPGDACNGSGK
jgi:hypothetical protein